MAKLDIITGNVRTKQRNKTENSEDALFALFVLYLLLAFPDKIENKKCRNTQNSAALQKPKRPRGRKTQPKCHAFASA
jgi:hypothetical protein